jgi:hypothetical protein
MVYDPGCGLVHSVVIEYAAGSFEVCCPHQTFLSNQEAAIPVPTDAAESLNSVDSIY